MTPRRPHLLLVLPVLLLLGGLAGCTDDPATATETAASTGATPSTSAAPAEPADHSPADPALPDDLALDAGLDRGDSDSRVRGPGRAVPGTSFADLCSPPAGLWPGPAVDRLVATESRPEYLQVREVALYADEDEARAVLEGLRRQVAACPEDGDRVFTGLQPTDDLTLTFGMHYAEGLGGTVWRIDQHDRSLVLVADSGEASEESLPAMAAGLARTHADLWSRIAPQLP